MQEALDTECNFGLSLGSLACGEVSSHWREGSPHSIKRRVGAYHRRIKASDSAPRSNPTCTLVHCRKTCYKIPATQPGACVSEYQDPLIGAFIEGYEISALIGEGGIGRFYRAKHTFIGKQIAIKALKPDYARNKISMARLLQEAGAVNEIRHENVVDIFNLLYRPDLEEAYILMELLEGRTLLYTNRRSCPSRRDHTTVS
jgi:serine/threonine protein kinase